MLKDDNDDDDDEVAVDVTKVGYWARPEDPALSDLE